MSLLSNIFSFLRRLYERAVFALSRLWTRYRALRPRTQTIIAIAAIILVIAFFSFLRSGTDEAAGDSVRSVAIDTVGALAGNEDGAATLFGSVRSITEADVLAKTSGTVTAVYATVGKEVGAGTILASMENAAESASVLSAQGSYEAALAARTITTAESSDAETDARNTFRSTFASVESALENYVDPLMSGPNRVAGVNYDLTEDRRELQKSITLWRQQVEKANTTDALTLVKAGETYAALASAFMTDFARAVNNSDSGATAADRAGVASARAAIDGARASLTGARTSVEVARTRTDSSGGATASADASVKQALGALRSAQAAFERTVVRAPIAGTVNFLPIRVGDYVTAMMHVATVARNGALEITAYVSEEDADTLSVGDAVTIDEKNAGTITFISPALDPVAKQIEVRVAAAPGVELLSGQSVRVRLANAPKTEAPVGPVMLPLASVKLSSGSRVVFSIGEDMRLIAHEVTVGEVRGDRIEITSELPLDLRIVRDARGLSAGEEVKIAGATN